MPEGESDALDTSPHAEAGDAHRETREDVRVTGPHASATNELRTAIAALMLTDAERLSRRFDALRRQRALPKAYELLRAEVVRSRARMEARAARVPTITYDNALPIANERERIMRTIREHQVVVLCGETGSGKTTQLPKMLLELGYGVRGVIGHTQPRRIAARSVAARIASELREPMGKGGVVGFQVRFGDESGPDNLIRLMTDGILLAQTQRDRLLMQYDAIIIDEAHERSLNIDFLLGYLRTILPRRPDLKVIVTSATIDPERFAMHFATGSGGETRPAPIVLVGGRTYPVDIRYRVPEEHDPQDWDETDDEFLSHLRDALNEVMGDVDGDVLVFLSGEREIREVGESLAGYRTPRGEAIEVLPLFARLTADEQARVFREHATRRVVLATNVAETSITVPGIRAVIDPGFARVNRYSPKTKVDRLMVEEISQASSNQRAGRCGRVGPGVCIRLYSQESFEARRQFTDPEIHRENLASVILQMSALHLGRVERFPFVEPPDARGVRDGYETLEELGAIDAEGRITSIGHALARFPVDPRMGRMLLASDREGALREVRVIVAAMSMQDVRERPLDKQDKADAAHAQFRDERSDYLSLLQLWNAWREQRRTLSSSKLRKWCRDAFISYVRMREWEDLHQQLKDICDELRVRESRERATPEAIHRSILAGLLCNVGTREQRPKDKQSPAEREAGNYVGTRDLRFFLHPGSVLAKALPAWVMSGEILRTTRTFARTVGPVDPAWIESIAPHLLRRTHSEPKWDRQTGRVVALERGTLYGLEVYAKRRVHYGEINPQESREIFLHHALLLGELSRVPPQLAHNLALEERVHELERRARRSHLLAEYDARYRFYEARVPKDIVTAGQFERWRFDAARHDARVLMMDVSDILAPGVTLPDATDFPDEIDLGAVRLPLTYLHDASSDADGVTVRVPIDALGQVPADRLAWIVPGHLREKVEAILRGLHKDYRRLLSAPSELAPRVAARLRDRLASGSVLDAIRVAIRDESTHDVPRDALAAVSLPVWMTMRVEVLDEQGKAIASGRDVNQLRAMLADRLREGARASMLASTRSAIRHWDFGDLPERVEVERGGMRFGAYPGIVDDGDAGVSLRMFDTFDAAQAATRGGSRRLFMLAASEPLRRHATRIPGLDQASLHYASIGPAGQFRAQVQELIADRAFIGDMLPVRTEKEFAFRVSRGIERLPAAVGEVAPLVAQIVTFAHALKKDLSQRHPPGLQPAIDEMRDHLASLVPPRFASEHPFDWLRHVPRYLQAMRLRYQRLQSGGVERDRRLQDEVAPFVKGLAELRVRHVALGLSPLKIEEFRWHIEEFRVQLFAQELRTSVPVSSKRLQELWQGIVRG